MATLQETVQAAIRAATGSSQTYEGDWHALLGAYGIPDASWSERVIALAQKHDSTIGTASAAHNYFLLNPTVLPTLALDFKTGRLDPRITFTRATVGSYFDSSGNMQTAASGAARFDYNPSTLKPIGLLVEGARQNLLLNSSTLATQDVVVTAVAHTISYYGTGQIVLSGAHSATVTSSGDYPTRTTYSFTPSAATLTCTVTGNVRFANLEIGAFASSWIPTAGAAVTRNADQPIMTGTNFSDWFNAAEGTLLGIGDTTSSGEFAKLINFDNDTINQVIVLVKNATDQIRFSTTENVSGVNCSIVMGSISTGVPYKTCGAYKVNDCAAASSVVNTISTDATATMPTVDRCRFGYGSAANVELWGHVQSFVYYDTRLTNAQIVALSAA